ncbi:MAG TPA: prolyl oligopeptidase family serine peptidase, partial [Thermoanaerobaculia bacterium]|nr:prolyl oligopeptidase family serine peptidase [Thermoanaerobaculia bacterium]
MPIRTLASAVALLLVAPALSGRPDTLDPGPKLSLDGLPPVPSALVEAVRPYTEIRGAAFRSWDPARREMLISTRFGETDQIHIVDRPGGDRRQLTFLPEPIGWASYHPRGGSFVFSSDTGGAEFFQLYRYDFADSTITLLTDGAKRHIGGPWSNRGDRLAFDKVDADAQGAFTEIWVVDPRYPESKREVATLRGGGWGLADWSLDDSELLLEEQVSASESSLWLIDIASGRQRRVTPDPAAGKAVWSNGRFADTGRTLFVSTNSGGEFRQLAALQIENGKLEILTPDLRWDVTAVELSPAGTVLAFLTNEGGWSRLYLLDTTTRVRRAVGALPAGVASGLRWHENGKELAVTVSSARNSGDVFVVDAPSLRVERWTRSETGGLDPASFVEPTEIEWQSFDGRAISGFLYQPDPARFPGRRPVIVDIHGGPEGQSRPDFRGTSNFWVSELGIAVVYPNVRGSTGYGKTFVGLDDGFGREGSYEDIGSLLDWIAKNPHLDADRVMITGGSYGGHMTFAIATRMSDRIRCAVAVIGISNLRTFLERTQAYRRDLRRAEYGDERDPKMHAFLEKIAPLNHAGSIRKPIFVVHGRNDPRVPWSESDQIVRAVRANGVPAWFLVAE